MIMRPNATPIFFHNLTRKYKLVGLFRYFLILWIIFSHISPGRSTRLVFAQTPTPENPSQEMAADLLEQMSPEERVGQLFIISFQGNDFSEGSLINTLISDYHIGGIILKVSNDNFFNPNTNQPKNAQEVLELNRSLQQVKWQASSLATSSKAGGNASQPSFIPLWIGMAQNAENYPYSQTIPGMTLLPNPMAIGATWNTNLAEQVGSILGDEMSNLGFNLLIGPSLDVLEARLIDTTGNRGTRSFGGDPYWVSQMGKAYISGIHTGSNQRVAVIAKHFPGHGSSDRLPEEEVSTIRKSLEELKSFDLAPFFAVTGNATSTNEIVDGLLTSHIRYQGLQGSIRATTRPVSFDPQALGLLINLPALNTWRQSGGLMVSDDLGSLAVRRFYDLTSQTFDARRVALNAFLSGNDLLYIEDFTSALEIDPLQATIRTLEFFTQKYREDSAFSQRVDESVLRILSRKFSLYGNFTLFNVLPSTTNLPHRETAPIIFDVARQSATLISPTAEDLDESIPDPPNQNDRIVFITDARTAIYCSKCEPFPIIATNSFQESVIRLYGPQAGGQITANNLTSYTLQDLQAMLLQEETPQNLQRDLERANWIIFSMLDAQANQPTYQTLSQFLSERPDLFQQKRLIVFTFSEPNYLDATNISKLSALYSLYSPSPQFLDIAAYLLFRELRPTGASPVSIPGIGYDLNEALFPDPELQISLELDLQTIEISNTGVTPSPTPPPEYRIGDIIPLRTGLILDHNGNPVPDGTQVAFIFSVGSESTSIRQIEYTSEGKAKTVFSVNNSGTLDIHVESENAISNTLRIEIPASSSNGQATEMPNEPTETPAPIPTLEPTEQVTQTITPEPEEERPGFTDWLIAFLISLGIAWSAYQLSAFIGQIRWGVRAAFIAFCGGLLAYSYVTLELPGSEILLSRSIASAVSLSTFSGSILGLLIVIIWKNFLEYLHKIKETEIKT